MVRSHWKYSVIKGHGILQHILYSMFVRKCLYCLHFWSICSHIQPDGFSSLSSLSKFSPPPPNNILCEVLCFPNQHTESGTCQDMDCRNLTCHELWLQPASKAKWVLYIQCYSTLQYYCNKIVLWRTVPCVKTNMKSFSFKLCCFLQY